MTVENKDFELFQKEFKRYQKLFGLNSYRICFKYEPLDGSFASIFVSQAEMVATVNLNSKLLDKDKPFKDIEGDAKHEAIHLLVSRLELNGRYRYLSDTEMNETTEELVNRLEDLIPNLPDEEMKQ